MNDRTLMHGDVGNAVKEGFSSGYCRHESFTQIDVTDSLRDTLAIRLDVLHCPGRSPMNARFVHVSARQCKALQCLNGAEPHYANWRVVKNGSVYCTFGLKRAGPHYANWSLVKIA